MQGRCASAHVLHEQQWIDMDRLLVAGIGLHVKLSVADAGCTVRMHRVRTHMPVIPRVLWMAKPSSFKGVDELTSSVEAVR
jgi:hypothetical protein